MSKKAKKDGPRLIQWPTNSFSSFWVDKSINYSAHCAARKDKNWDFEYYDSVKVMNNITDLWCKFDPAARWANVIQGEEDHG